MRALVVGLLAALGLTAPLGATAVEPSAVEARVVDLGCWDVDTPLLVDECGDAMVGDLAFEGAAGIQFPGGKLLASPDLRFAGVPVCLAGLPLSGCGAGDITGVTAGFGLSGGGPSGDVSLAVNTAAIQQRVAGACAAGQSIRVINGNGTVACEVDDGISYVAGAGLALSGTTFSLGTTGCVAGEVWKFTGATWSCDPDANSGGDITDVVAGSGLSGGAASGAATLSVNTALIQSRVASACAAGQSIRVINADGTVTCEPDDNTAYSAGAGLSLAGTAFSVATGGVTSAMVLDGSLGAADVDSSQVQRRLGACGPGMAVRLAAADGTPTCIPVDGRPGFRITSLDTVGNVGRNNSLIIGTDGLGLISYHDQTNGDLKVAHCEDLACTTATKSTLDSVGVVGLSSSITIGADGLGVVSYYDQTNGNLKFARCQNTACTSATLRVLHSVGDVGKYSSITVGADSFPIISYYDATNGDLRVAHCLDVACAAVELALVDSSGDRGWFTSIAVGQDDRALISYGGNASNSFTARCLDLSCSAATLSSLSHLGHAPTHGSTAIAQDGIPWYTAGITGPKTVLVRCSRIDCLLPTGFGTVDGLNLTGHSSMTFAPDGRALVAYHHFGDGSLRLLRCSDAEDCARPSYHLVDDSAVVGKDTSITTGVDGLALLSYYDETNGDLKVAHLANAFGVPFYRPR